MHRWLRVGNALLISVLITACVPIFGRYPRYPKLEGVITSQGQPISGATVVYSHTLEGDSCPSRAEVTVTDELGRFELPGDYGHVWFYPFIFGGTVDPVWAWSLCVERAGVLTFLHHSSSGHTSPEWVALACKIELGCEEVAVAR